MAHLEEWLKHRSCYVWVKDYVIQCLWKRLGCVLWSYVIEFDSRKDSWRITSFRSQEFRRFTISNLNVSVYHVKPFDCSNDLDIVRFEFPKDKHYIHRIRCVLFYLTIL